MEPEGLLPCSQEPVTGLILSQLNPVHTLQLYFSKMTGVHSRQGQWWDFLFRYRLQTGSGAHPASCPKGTPEVKQPGREADHSSPPSAEVKNAWSCTSFPQYVFMAWYLVNHRDFTLPSPYRIVHTSVGGLYYYL
jgi:hypothetical protein